MEEGWLPVAEQFRVPLQEVAGGTVIFMTPCSTLRGPSLHTCSRRKLCYFTVSTFLLRWFCVLFAGSSPFGRSSRLNDIILNAVINTPTSHTVATPLQRRIRASLLSVSIVYFRNHTIYTQTSLGCHPNLCQTMTVPGSVSARFPSKSSDKLSSMPPRTTLTNTYTRAHMGFITKIPSIWAGFRSPTYRVCGEKLL